MEGAEIRRGGERERERERERQRKTGGRKSGRDKRITPSPPLPVSLYDRLLVVFSLSAIPLTFSTRPEVEMMN